MCRSMPFDLPKRILYISYPLLTVSEESAGGAEQMLWVLEREMNKRGVKTTVAASAGSRVSGDLFVTGEPCRLPDDFDRRNREHQDHIVEFVRQNSHHGRPFDLIHDKSGSFWSRAHEVDVPVLATLHLPRHFYAEDTFKSIPQNVSFNCVSQSQAKAFADLPNKLGVAPNGIALDRFIDDRFIDDRFVNNQNGTDRGRSGLLWLGRVCEEKAPHLALEIAGKMGMPITLTGQVYPFSYHQDYYQREILPRMNGMANAQWIDSPSFEQKLHLLRTATALLITSQVDETSSLVAMEAAACGTPVIAFNRGALPEVIRNGMTGYLVTDLSEAHDAISHIGQISGDICREHACENFSGVKTADRYAGFYDAIVCLRAGKVLSRS